MLKKIPSIEPKNVPIEPIDVPINKNILIIAILDDPIVLSKAISVSYTHLTLPTSPKV